MARFDRKTKDEEQQNQEQAPLIGANIPGFALVQEQLFARLKVRQLEAFWRDLQSLENLWPIVLPLLAWVFWRSYRDERRTFIK